MASILDTYNKMKPATAKINTKGTDKMPIESTESSDKALVKSRHGAIGQGSGGFDNKKTYSSTVKTK